MPDLPPAPVPPTWWRSATALASAVRARCSAPAAAAGAALALVVVVTVAVAAFRTTTSPPVELTLPRAGGPGEPAAAGEGGGSEDAGPDGEIVVHVAGAAVHPGLYRLPARARVADALDAAGGPAAEADLDALNLATRLTDGERIYIPRKGEVAAGLVPDAGAPAGAAGAAGGPVDLNAATAAQLVALPGIGPATAEAIVSYRREHGPFRSVDQLLEVRGIGPAKLAALRDKVRVGEKVRVGR